MRKGRGGGGGEERFSDATSLHGRHKVNRIEVHTVLPANNNIKNDTDSSYFARSKLSF